MKWLHNILKGASLSGALFVFQACYGMPQTPMLEERGEAPMTFCLVSPSGKPLKGIVIAGAEDANAEYRTQLGVTAEDGTCTVNIPYIRNVEGPALSFEDPSNVYSTKDTVLYDLRERDITITLSKN